MGNCCSGHKSSIVCAGDDDDYYGYESMKTAEPNTESTRLLASEINRPSSSSSSSSGREVKIKMTKKQLEELLTEVDAHGVPLDQLLHSLINNHNDDHDHVHHPFETSTDQELQGPWTPTLQSIPEAD